jgi:hypothetical protein
LIAFYIKSLINQMADSLLSTCKVNGIEPMAWLTMFWKNFPTVCEQYRRPNAVQKLIPHLVGMITHHC